MQEDKNAMRFPQKLRYLINMGTNAIKWGHTGKTILLNYRILHGYLHSDQSVFKTGNISSFVRQLNLYGFRKVTSHLQDPVCNSSNPYIHEYVHDYFQVDRPEILDKITRKPFTIKKHSHKPKSMLLSNNSINEPAEQFLTPLQKARRVLHNALRKAAQDLINPQSSKVPDCYSFKFEHDATTGINAEEDEGPNENEFDWIINGNENKENIPPPQNPPEMIEMVMSPPADPPGLTETTPIHRNLSQEQDALMSFNNMTSMPIQSQPSAVFSGPFLSMPDLDAEPADSPDVKLLAEFNIEIDQGTSRKTGDKDYQNSMNCVLPSISNDSVDMVDVTMAQRAAEDCASNHYNDCEWDQMLNDIIASRGSGPECSSDLKELYSQISRTIDLLNS